MKQFKDDSQDWWAVSGKWEDKNKRKPYTKKELWEIYWLTGRLSYEMKSNLLAPSPSKIGCNISITKPF